MPMHIARMILDKISMRIFVAVFPAILILSLFGCATVQSNERKDTIDHLSFSHDGRKILFDRCLGENCQIQVYDLKSGELSAYQSPPNERWTMARQSYDGKRIVFSVIPIGEEYLDLSGIQIAVMDVDGKNYKILTTGHFPKIYPTFSHSGKKVLYVKASRMRKQSRTPASGYDAWEVDIETGKETRLTYFEYMFMHGVTYFPGDEKFLYHADGPFAFPGLDLPKDDIKAALRMIGEETKKKNIYLVGVLTMKRGELYPERPYNLFEKGHPPIRPLLTKDGKRMLFEAAGRAGDIFLYSPDGNHQFVGGGGSITSAAISPDGGVLGVIAADIGIHVFSTYDGSRLERIYTSVSEIEGFDYNRLPKYKLLGETPSHIIIR